MTPTEPDKGGAMASDLSGTAPLTASMTNSDGTDNIYVTKDPSVNQLTLVVTNQSNGQITLPPGEPVAWDTLPKGASAVYLYIEGLLANPEVAAIDMSAVGWKADTFQDPNELQYLVIAPEAEVQLQPGDSLSFSLTNVLVAEAPISGTLSLTLAGATGISTVQATVSVFVNIADPPQPHDQTLTLDINFYDPTVYTGSPSTLVLRLINHGEKALVPDGAKAWGPTPPTFQLTFLYGDQLGALTQLKDATNITGTLGSEYGNHWKQVMPNRQGAKPYWTMQPDPNGGGHVIGHGTHATVEFKFSGILAALPRGVDQATTVAYVSWSGVPGYKDGSTGVSITKRAGPEIIAFSADPAIVAYGQQSMQTTLTWQTENAHGGVTFDVPGVGRSEVFGESGSGPVPGGINVGPGVPLTINAHLELDATASEIATSGITASKTIKLPAVSRIDIPLLAGPGLAPPQLVTSPGRDQAYVFFDADSRFAVVDRAAPKPPAILDLNTLVMAPLHVASSQAAVSSADGSAVYVAVLDGSGEPWLIALDSATLTITMQASIARPLGSNVGITGVMLAATPDGKTVFAATLVERSRSQLTVPYELLTIDATTGRITAHVAWGAMPNVGNIFATNSDGSKLFLMNSVGVGIFETAELTPVSFLNFEDLSQWAAIGAGALSQDGRHVYLPVCDIGHYDKVADTAPLYLTVIGVDADATMLTLERSVALGIQQQASDFLVGNAVATYWGGSWTALSVDQTTVYVLVPPSLAVIDLATDSVRWWPSPVPTDVTTQLIVADLRPQTVYLATGSVDENGSASLGTFSAISLTE